MRWARPPGPSATSKKGTPGARSPSPCKPPTPANSLLARCLVPVAESAFERLNITRRGMDAPGQGGSFGPEGAQVPGGRALGRDRVHRRIVAADGDHLGETGGGQRGEDLARPAGVTRR